MTWCHCQIFLKSSHFSFKLKLVFNALLVLGYDEKSGLKRPPSEFCPITWDLSKLIRPHLACMSLMTSQYVSQNGTLAAFKEGGKVTPPHPDLHQDEQVVWQFTVKRWFWWKLSLKKNMKRHPLSCKVFLNISTQTSIRHPT